jgi:hypothetical protein
MQGIRGSLILDSGRDDWQPFPIYAQLSSKLLAAANGFGTHYFQPDRYGNGHATWTGLTPSQL